MFLCFTMKYKLHSYQPQHELDFRSLHLMPIFEEIDHHNVDTVSWELRATVCATYKNYCHFLQHHDAHKDYSLLHKCIFIWKKIWKCIKQCEDYKLDFFLHFATAGCWNAISGFTSPWTSLRSLFFCGKYVFNEI